jgi:hypothetical protein
MGNRSEAEYVELLQIIIILGVVIVSIFWRKNRQDN